MLEPSVRGNFHARFLEGKGAATPLTHSVPERIASQSVVWYGSGVTSEVIMHGTREIIEEATALPVEGRAAVVDSLLRSLNMPDPEIDRAWLAVAKRRLADIRSGRVAPVPGDQVFAKIRERFA